MAAGWHTGQDELLEVAFKAFKQGLQAIWLHTASHLPRRNLKEGTHGK
jgi:hypothetical protein